jgi:integrase
MSDTNSTSPTGNDNPKSSRLQPSTTAQKKPAKPRADFPLGFHPAGYWCKKILGKIHYFGPRFDPADQDAANAAAEDALEEYNKQADALHAGRKPRPDPDALTVKALVNLFLDAKKALVSSGELSPRTWACYKEGCDAVIKAFSGSRLVSDLAPEDFVALRKQLAKRYGPHGLGTRIQCVRSTFKYAFDSDLIDRPVRFGPEFKRPSKQTLHKHRAKAGPKLFTSDEVRRLLTEADMPVKAMILLGVNAGFGNSDCGQLPLSALDLDAGWIDYPRPKTGINRRCPLWPETVEAIREALASRPQAKDPADAGLVFITKYGGAWHKEKGGIEKDRKGNWKTRKIGNRPVTHEMVKLLQKLHINGRKGLGFYTLRHTFRTIADEAKDQVAADFIMGHATPHMSSFYRERISDERLKAVSDHVRAWLFPPKKTEAAKEPEETSPISDKPVV